MSKSAGPEGTRTIELANGYTVIIDEKDYAKIAPFCWFAKKTGGDKIYAARSQRDDQAVRTIYMHRFIMNCPPGKEVDHKDTVRLNCRRSNLEIVTRRENIRRRWNRAKCAQPEEN